ncbi:ribonuclease HIII [Verrucomicrobium sp. GAS474]|uniref:ribonuclease HIII n=1 Tax=Verrucomicrobium sp. GAS474 TaxID=1882831 RepID=UPI0008797308|nr:ribonuclease HIII [Verrucomicrobium sp. GAS474]SDU07589.1 ribonuclease HIII [Verrucomicrobium sp. GAS474]
MIKPPSSFTFKLTEEQIELLRVRLTEQGYDFSDLPYGYYRARKGKGVTMVGLDAYLSGKLVVSGKGAPEVIEFLIEPEITGVAKLGYDEVHNPEAYEPHIGIDESGKGDFFGPLVVAAAYTNDLTAKQLLSAGVKDSKQIGSDAVALKIGDAIVEILGPTRYSVLALGPEKYNELYAKFKNLNRFLAWGHATVLENLLTQHPGCKRAISDQFANAAVLRSALKERGKTIELVQRTKAESDVAVAAASILARAEFLRRMERLGQDAGLGGPLPKGASGHVAALGRKYFAAHGSEALARLSKRHFKTFSEITGEPPITPPNPFRKFSRPK